MSSRPYLRAAVRAARNRLRTEPLSVVLTATVPVLASALVVPLIRPTMLGFLDRAIPELLAYGLSQTVLRLALVVVGFLAIDVYEALIRGHDREVASLLPVDPAGVAIATVLTVALRRWWILPSSAILLSPIAIEGHVAAWAAAMVVLVGCVLLGLWASAAAHLLAIEVAEAPWAAPLLDLARGDNPRPQAAFLYAPGALLLATAAFLWQASSAVPAAAEGDGRALVSLFAPLPVALAAGLLVPTLARRAWFRGTVVIAEIDARYAALADPKDSGHVYLDWLVRWVPVGMRPYVLDDLRHGWRTRRTLVSGAWLLGLVAAAAGFTSLDAGMMRATGVLVAGVLAVAANGVWLAVDEPAFLRAWLPPRAGRADLARAIALTAWATPTLVLGAAGVAARFGLGAAMNLIGIGLVALVAGIGLALAAGRLRERAWLAYVPTAAVLAAASIAWVAT